MLPLFGRTDRAPVCARHPDEVALEFRHGQGDRPAITAETQQGCREAPGLADSQASKKSDNRQPVLGLDRKAFNM